MRSREKDLTRKNCTASFNTTQGRLLAASCESAAKTSAASLPSPPYKPFPGGTTGAVYQKPLLVHCTTGCPTPSPFSTVVASASPSLQQASLFAIIGPFDSPEPVGTGSRLCTRSSEIVQRESNGPNEISVVGSLSSATVSSGGDVHLRVMATAQKRQVVEELPLGAVRLSAGAAGFGRPRSGYLMVVAEDPKKKPKWTKGKRRKRARDVNAPERPLTGYVRFLNDRREAVRAANPTANFPDVTKLLAIEWSKLSPQEKQAMRVNDCICSVQKYLDEAEKDRERYTKELEQYQQTEAYRMFTKKQHEKKAKGDDASAAATTNGTAADAVTEDSKKDELPGYNIPIFTEEFLDYNKGCEAELRQLRKSNTEYEEQNAILGKHIDTMKAAIEKLEVETVQQKNNNLALQQHLAALRTKLAASFSSLPLPAGDSGPQCGVSSSRRFKDDRIVGGTEAKDAEYPWQVSVQRKKDNFHFCGGSLIAPDIIVTAGHCVDSTSPDTISVQGGLLDLRDPPSYSQRRSVSRIVVHSGYNDVSNDIALLKLETPFDLAASEGHIGAGDSGGPAVQRNSGLYTLVGIVSFGLGCAIFPGFYTRVPTYIPWITENVAALQS
ncbi:hypothetical protein HPB51_009596 [Rhipicephalus microplus]|uniref:Uncharacterized protein n=1 Tax=Rhipicephalus microplus TaxID=6941 RepID=A0A9J6DMB8_RHIMP|nr:hypothetical protein HPB51_009596 [Rhipicephalus microplus]